MQDVVHPLHRALRHREVCEVAFDELNARHMREVLAMAGNEAVGDADALAAARQLFCEVGSDEACPTGDEVVGHG